MRQLADLVERGETKGQANERIAEQVALLSRVASNEWIPEGLLCERKGPYRYD